MRALRFAASVAISLCVTGAATAASLKVVSIWIANSQVGFFWVGHAIEVPWIAGGVSLQTKIKVELLRRGLPARVLAQGLPVSKDGHTNSNGEVFNYFIWQPGPAPSDVACSNAFRVSTEDGSLSAVSDVFPIFDALEFKDSHGSSSRVRVDAPVGGVLLRGQTTNIAWSYIAASADTIKLELYYQNAKVGDIGTIPVNPQACPVRGQFPWIVGRVSAVANPAMVPDGKNVIAGNYYEIRASTSVGGYLGGDFVIALTGGKPGPVGTPLHKVTPGAGTIKN